MVFRAVKRFGVFALDRGTLDRTYAEARSEQTQCPDPCRKYSNTPA